MKPKRVRKNCEKCGHPTYGHNDNNCARVQAEDKVKQAKADMAARDMVGVNVTHACLKKTRVGALMVKAPNAVNTRNELIMGWYAPRWAVRVAEATQLDVSERRRLIEQFYDGDHEEAIRLASVAVKLIGDDNGQMGFPI